ncbi:MAG: hypothetical protein ACYCYF_02995, partial [Anaerolineae bacterium]
MVRLLSVDGTYRYSGQMHVGAQGGDGGDLGGGCSPGRRVLPRAAGARTRRYGSRDRAFPAGKAGLSPGAR